MKKRIAIIGAGISGLVLAQQLKHYAEIVVFEKSTGVGGRMSTHDAGPFYFDHGTQTFTARTPAFQEFLAPFMKSGIIEEWRGEVINFERNTPITPRPWREKHLVASPNMNSLCKNFAEDVDVRLSVEIAALSEKHNDIWELRDVEGKILGHFDWVISTAPPAQSVELLKIALPFNSPLHSTRMKGCYAVMIGFNRPWHQNWIAARVRNAPIKWITVNSSKPSRNKAVTTFVVHSRNNWAENHINDDINAVQKFLLSLFETVSGIDCSHADFISTHFWQYAIVESTKKSGVYYDTEQNLAATSDWASTSRIEEVCMNAVNLARMIENAV